MEESDIRTHLNALGDILASQHLELGVVLVGGAALLLQGLRARTTTDIDIIAAALLPERGRINLIPPSQLPPAFAEAVKRVARDFGLPPEWLNSEVSAQLKTGLPQGFQDRVTWHQHGGLRVGLASRRDLIFLKLYAATDQDPSSRHTQDLLALRPTDAELEGAANWVRTQDAADAFSEMLDRVVAYVRAHAE